MLTDSDGDRVTLTNDDDVIEAVRCVDDGTLRIYVEMKTSPSTAVSNPVSAVVKHTDAHTVALFAEWRAARDELLKGRPVTPTIPRLLKLPPGPPIKVSKGQYATVWLPKIKHAFNRQSFACL